MRRIQLLGALLIGLAACGGGSSGETVTFDGSPTNVDAVVVAGDVSVQADANITGTRVEYVASGDDVNVSIDLVEGALVISDDCDGDGCSVDYAVLVEAAETDVSITADSGNVTVISATGAVNATAGSGAVTLTQLTGDIQVLSADGGVLGTGLVSDSAAFEVEVGDIDVTFDEPVTVLVAATGDGDVTVQLPEGSYAFETAASDGSVDNLLETTDGASNQVTLSTDRGDITIYRR